MCGESLYVSFMHLTSLSLDYNMCQIKSFYCKATVNREFMNSFNRDGSPFYKDLRTILGAAKPFAGYSHMKHKWNQ